MNHKAGFINIIGKPNVGKSTLMNQLVGTKLSIINAKAQIFSKRLLVSSDSSKKRTNKFAFTTMRLVFVRFLEEIEDTKKTFRNNLTFNLWSIYSKRFYGLHFPLCVLKNNFF